MDLGVHITGAIYYYPKVMCELMTVRYCQMKAYSKFDPESKR